MLADDNEGYLIRAHRLLTDALDTYIGKDLEQLYTRLRKGKPCPNFKIAATTFDL